MFCGWLGSVVGNLVLVYGAQGGVHLAGGILPQIKDFLVRSDFAARFRDKGQMREVLDRVPVVLVDHGQLGVIGAAQWYVEQQQVQSMFRGQKKATPDSPCDESSAAI